MYEGYEHRRTIGFKEGLSRGGNEEILGRKGRARTWEFALAEREERGFGRGEKGGNRVVGRI